MLNHPPASEESREVANLTERKNPRTPVWLGLYFPPFLQCEPPQKIVEWVYLDSDFRLKSNF